MKSTVAAEQTVQEWGNGLGVRITAPIAKPARLARGTPIRVEVVEGGVFVRVSGKPRLSLAQKLRAFNPAKHGGEVMVTRPVGVEAFADRSS
jgi:antitoxin component of MazEF toxin-antitoxin module